MDISPRDILEAVRGEAADLPEAPFELGRISTDTRTLERNDVFFALKGAHYDGHDFLADAVASGARLLVVSDAGRVPRGVPFIRVPDTLVAYGDLARVWRRRFRAPAVAITGSVGKTTAKEITAHLLAGRYRTLRNRGTENNLIGVPKTLLQAGPDTQVMVLEIGTSCPGEIARLGEIVDADIGVLTKIGFAHLDGLGDLEGVKKEKLSLVPTIRRGGAIILNGQDPNLVSVNSGVHRAMRCGFDPAFELSAEKPWCHDKGSSFRVDLTLFGEKGRKELFETPLLGRHNVVLCLQALAVAAELGVEWKDAQKALASFRSVPGRLSLRRVEDLLFIDDSYNSNPTSFEAALETLKEFKVRERKIVVCGDMLELGELSESLHRRLGAILAEMRFDAVIAAGPACRALVEEAVERGHPAARIQHVRDAREAGVALKGLARQGDHVLVKGSRGMKMETVIECFTSCSTR